MGQVAASLSYGINDNIDLVLTVPYQWGKIKEGKLTTYDGKGISDIALEVKWRFFKNNGYSLALKPGIRFPTGNSECGLSTGRLGGQLFLIGSKELGPWVFYADLGYVRNENNIGERYNILRASMATTWEIVKDLKLVANIGYERNHYNNAKDDPFFLSSGIIYSLAVNIDSGLGIKYGLTSSEIYTPFIMAGITIRF
jgi:hypothetical protein